MNSSHEARLLAAVEQAHEQLVLARQERDRKLQASARTDKICLALQERLLELEAAVRQSEQRRAADADAAVARLTQRHAEFTASLADAARSRDALGQQLHAARASLEEARRARQADEMAAAETLRAHRAEFEVALATAATSRAAAEQQVESLQTALQHAEARHLLEIAADAERHAVREAEAATNLAQISDERDTLTRQLNDAATALEESQQQRAREEADARVALERAEEHRAAAEQQVEHLRATLQHAETRHVLQRTTDAKRHAARDAEVAANLAQVSDERDTLARRLSDATAALEESHRQRAAEQADARTTLEATAAALERSDERRAADAIAATAQLAERQAEFEVALAAVAASRAVAEHEIERLRVDYQEAEARHVLERAADAERHAVHDAEVAANLAQVSAARDALARQLSDATAALEESHKQRAREEADARATLEATAAALERAEERRAADAMAATAQLAERQTEFEVALAAAAASRAAADQEIERLRADSQHAEARHVSERTADAERHAVRDAEVAAHLAQVSAARDALARQLSDATAALEQSQKQRAIEEATARRTLEETISQAARMQREADEHHASERATTEARSLAVREELERQLSAAAAVHAAAEREIERLQDDYQHAQTRHVSERAADAERYAVRDAEVAANLAQVSAARDALARQLSDATAAAQRALERAAQHAESERVAAGAREQELRGELARVRRGLLTAASALRRRTTAQRALAEKRFAEERAEFERHLGARDEAIRQIQAKSDSELTRLRAEYDHTRQSLEHLRDAFNTLERVSSEHALERARLEGVVADRDSQMSAQEAAHLAAERAGTEALRQAGETLRQTVDANERETRRQFEHAPHALGRVTRGGVLVEANQALARMLGYRSTDDLGKPDLAAAVFEAPADLQWLIDRAAASGAPAIVETHWTKKDRSRLTVRLQVVRTNQEWIEIAAEDLTLLRTTEDNLRQARRLEAVGRLASEVAVTCDTLLRGVSHGGQYWLAALGSDLGHRRQGERLLGDVAEATSLLQRLAAYGNEQIDALEPVNLQHVLRNLEPVLKRVVGDDIQVVLPKHIRPYSIDVERTRVERVLVNVASYARERMPHGGRLKIDLASTVVDRTFLDKYPNVRPGPHVIATVTEERSTTPAGLPVPWPAPSIDDGATATGEKPGVDLSALLRLLGDCGGHLWVAAEPPGNMTLKIHLPLRASEHASSPAGSLARSVGSRSLGRWSRH